jgi:hypothetical protein
VLLDESRQDVMLKKEQMQALGVPYMPEAAFLRGLFSAQ